MQIPSARLHDAEDPEPPAVLILGVKVIAGFAASFPPQSVDALGPGGMGDSMHPTGAGEGNGRAVLFVRGGGNGLDFFGGGEKVQGPGRMTNDEIRITSQ